MEHNMDTGTLGITSFQVRPKASIWETLRESIEDQIRKDGIRAGALEVLPGSTERPEDFIAEAVEIIFHDVSEFYGWYFNEDDDRTSWIGPQATQNKTIHGDLIPFTLDMPEDLRGSVGAVVADNLEAMREVDEIPAGQDTDSLDEVITDSLTRYIVNWGAWYYSRRELDAIDQYFDQLGIHEDIYYGDDYGDLTTLLDNTQYDGVSDVPYIAEE